MCLEHGHGLSLGYTRPVLRFFHTINVDEITYVESNVEVIREARIVRVISDITVSCV